VAVCHAFLLSYTTPVIGLHRHKKALRTTEGALCNLYM